MSRTISWLLSETNIHPVLVDVGASGDFPQIWKKIAPYSVYVGFDPDLRELKEITDTDFYRAVMINEAVTDDVTSREIPFYLTRSPYCSSTLKPNAKALANFLFADFFVIEKESRVQAISLDEVLERLSLSSLDWFKADTQGTDLRLFKSLNEDTRIRVLAVDVEPGLINAYVGEDLFVDTHRELIKSGFWLSNLNVQGWVRFRKSSVDIVRTAHPDISERLIRNSVKPSPGWVEARYLRTLESMKQAIFSQRDYILLWVFALLDGQLGFALDVALAYEHTFGQDSFSQIMQAEPIRRLKRTRFLTFAKILTRHGLWWLKRGFA